ncbi:hypothetical protein TNCV_3209481 [Trichonephila clavipes]|nr:hypothetical protein TNCV_3209481 [Trichonephila clavipes]
MDALGKIKILSRNFASAEHRCVSLRKKPGVKITSGNWYHLNGAAINSDTSSCGKSRAVGNLVARLSSSKPEDLASMPVPPNALRVHTEYVLVKSVGPKALWAVTAETTSAVGWRIFPSPPVPCLNWGVGDR